MLINRKIVLSFDYLDFDNEVKISELLSSKSINIESIRYSDIVIIHKSDYVRLCSKIGTDSLSNEFVKIFVKNSKVCKYNPCENNFTSELKNSCVMKIGGYHSGDKRKIYCPDWVINKLELDNMIDDSQVKYIKGRLYFREHFILPKCSLVHLKRIPEIDTLKIILDKKDGSSSFYDSFKDLEDEIFKSEIFEEGLRMSYKCLQVQNYIYFYLPSLNIYMKGFVSKMEVSGPEDMSGYGIITSRTKILI